MWQIDLLIHLLNKLLNSIEFKREKLMILLEYLPIYILLNSQNLDISVDVLSFIGILLSDLMISLKLNVILGAILEKN
ncbi:hypothetical protein AY599_17740 [Leptolyngbya valderiana BDU 20041]|nr:hypothetical protein AY599_17740 [Leptolyngbya valderiana BDU 20041]